MEDKVVKKIEVAPLVQRANVSIYFSVADRELLGKAFALPLNATGKDYKPFLLEYARKVLEGSVLVGNGK
jgi:hypothetical protein